MSVLPNWTKACESIKPEFERIISKLRHRFNEAAIQDLIDLGVARPIDVAIALANDDCERIER